MFTYLHSKQTNKQCQLKTIAELQKVFSFHDKVLPEIHSIFVHA